MKKQNTKLSKDLAKDSKTESLLRRENDDLKKRLKRKRDDCKFFVAVFKPDHSHRKYRRPDMNSIVTGIIFIVAVKGKLQGSKCMQKFFTDRYHM